MTTFYAVLAGNPDSVDDAVASAYGLLSSDKGVVREFWPNVGKWKPGGRAAHAAIAGMADDFAFKVSRSSASDILTRFDPDAALPK